MYTVEEMNGIHFISSLKERATIEDARQFKEFLLNQIEKDGVRKMVIDFSGVMFIDSSFLSAMVTALKRINDFTGDIKVTNLESPVRLMFELTRLYKVFEIFETNEEAVLNY